MSYPDLQQVLVVEDELDAKEHYDAVLEKWVKRGEIAPPTYAFCYKDAHEQLQQNRIFHLVILDLRIPEQPGMPPEDLDLGMAVLDLCAKRDAYPVPALMVRSGYLAESEESDLRSMVESAFHYGVVLVKGGSLDSSIEAAISHVRDYSRTGIHVHGAGKQQFPPLAPRDVDLLRRCIQGDNNLGVDLQWWAADYSEPSAPFERCAGWTQTLMGPIILREGVGYSHPAFFKFAPVGDAQVLERGANIFSQQLPHIKKIGFLSAGNRCLLATQKVGDSDQKPISLEEYLGRDRDEVTDHIGRIADDIVAQIRRLGHRSINTEPCERILWSSHDHVGDQWEKWADQKACDALDESPTPDVVLDALKNGSPVRYCFQTCLHGDLNATNVCLDVLEAEVRAYIIDPGSCNGGVDIRDFAMLEVTVLLHQGSDSESLVEYCSCLFEDVVMPPSDLDCGSGSKRARNTLRFISELRRRALVQVDDTRIYALMVLDNALMQLGGLRYEVSNSKIRSPHDAALLAALVCSWLKRVAPEYLT